MTEVLHMAKRSGRVAYRGVAITDFEVRAMPIEALWAPVSVVPAFVAELGVSIKERGLLNPVVVVRAPREDVIRHFQAVKAGLPEGTKGALPPGLPEEEVINAIWGGSNRVAAARDLGYGEIDCVIVHDFYTAAALQDAQRMSYNVGEPNAAHE